MKTIWLPDSLCAENSGEPECTAAITVVFSTLLPINSCCLSIVTSVRGLDSYVDVVNVYRTRRITCLFRVLLVARRLNTIKQRTAYDTQNKFTHLLGFILSERR